MVASLNLHSSHFLQQLSWLVEQIKRRLMDRPKTIHSSQGQTSLEFLEYRGYVPGDDFGRIDWHVWQRWQEFFVKEYAVVVPRHWTICLDISASMSLYHKFEIVQQIAAALMYVALHLGDKVSFFIMPMSQGQFFRYYGKSQTMTMLSMLASLQPNVRTPNWAVPAYLPYLTQHSKAVVLSDFYDPVYFEFLPWLRKKNMAVVAGKIMAEEEKSPNWRGTWILEDAETGATQIMDLSQKWQQQYQQRLQQHQRHFEGFCRQYHIRTTEILTSETWLNKVISISKWLGLIR